MISLFTRRRLAFSAVEWPELKKIALAGNAHIEDCLITSRRTMIRYITANYHLYYQEVKTSLFKALSPIHISTDLWTSPSRHSLLAICAQWVDEDYQLRKALLSLSECRDSHSGESQARLVMETLKKFEIQSKLGYHTGDNATSNDTLIESLSQKLFNEHKVS